MATLVSSYQDSNNQRYLYVHPIGAAYRVDLLGCVRRVKPSVGVALTKIRDYTTKDFLKKGLPDMLSHLISAIKQDANACKIIGKKLGWKPSGKGLECQVNFGKWLKTRDVETWERLDLRGLKLDRLPFHIGMFTGLKEVWIDDPKQLRYIPPELPPSVKILPEEPPEEPHFPCQPPFSDFDEGDSFSE